MSKAGHELPPPIRKRRSIMHATVDGKAFKFVWEPEKMTLTIRKRRARKTHTVSASQIVDFAVGQLRLF